MHDRQNIALTISSGTILKIFAWAIFIALLFYVRDIVLAVLTAVVVASAVEPAALWLGKYKIPRVPAVIGIYVVLVLVVASIIILFVPPVIGEINRLAADLPGVLESITFSDVLPSASSVAPQGLAEATPLSNFIQNLESMLSNASQGLFKVLSTVFGGALSFILIFVLSFYLAVQERGIENFLRIILPINRESYAIDLWRRSQKKIGLWMQGQFLLAVLIGVFVFIGLTIVGIKFALTLAILAALLELIPIFGPVIAAIPALILGFSMSIPTGVGVLLVYVIIQQFENHLIYPVVVTKIVGVPPLLVIVALLVGAKIAGFLGILLAVPVAAVLVEVLNDLERKKEERLRTVTPGAAL